MLSHRNLLANLAVIDAKFGFSADSRVVIWLPPYHDMGLIGGILHQVVHGHPLVLMAPLHALQKPLRWLQAVSRHRATVSGGPNFAYDLCVRGIARKSRRSADLRLVAGGVQRGRAGAGRDAGAVRAGLPALWVPGGGFLPVLRAGGGDAVRHRRRGGPAHTGAAPLTARRLARKQAVRAGG